MSLIAPPAEQLAVQSASPPKARKRPHVYELDPLRAITALVVIIVHVLAFTAYLQQSERGQEIHNALVVSVHFTRALFMAVTAFSLAYVYYDRKFSIIEFWKKRSIGALLPYCIWSVIYIWVNTSPSSIGELGQKSLIAILTGEASYQLYYILLTLQFYLLLPLFLLFLKWTRNHPWLVVGCSLALQLLLFWVNYHYVQTGPFASNRWVSLLNQYQNRLILTYPFYFILGGVAALHFQEIRTFLRQHGRWIAVGMSGALAAVWGHFFLQVRFFHESIGYATSVLQPMMVVYSAAITIGCFWLACRWTQRRGTTERPRWYRMWQELSNASFGIYLVHALVLTVVLQMVTRPLAQTVPAALNTLLTWFLTTVCTLAISIALARTPIMSRLVGRSQPLPRREKRQE
jgi:peptidoglycan/LPS O-acetylase OafA/YrhL